jgi:hypothetical protein
MGLSCGSRAWADRCACFGSDMRIGWGITFATQAETDSYYHGGTRSFMVYALTAIVTHRSHSRSVSALLLQTPERPPYASSTADARIGPAAPGRRLGTHTVDDGQQASSRITCVVIRRIRSAPRPSKTPPRLSFRADMFSVVRT